MTKIIILINTELIRVFVIFLGISNATKSYIIRKEIFRPCIAIPLIILKVCTGDQSLGALVSKT